MATTTRRYIKGLPLKFVKDPVTFYQNVYVGEDGKGYDFYFYGETAGSYVYWDASANSLKAVGGAQITIGEAADGVDVLFYGDTSGSYVQWDASDDRLEFVESKMDMTTVAETNTDPGRQIYLQRTYTGAACSAGLTGIEVRSTFNGSANSTSMEVKGGEFKARHTNANTKNVGTFKGVIGNCDSKTGAKTITSAWALEGQIDCGTGSTITTGAGCRVAYNEDGTVTNAYGLYVDGTSVWDVGLKMTASKVVTGIEMGACTTGINLTGSMTDGMIISGACSDNGIEITGTCATSIAIGTSSTDMAFGTTVTNRAIELYTSSASTNTGTSVRPIYMRHTVLGTGGVGHRAEFHTRCDVVVGTWINALKGYMEFDASLTAGRTTGLASAVCAELKMPNSAVPTGHYYPLEVEFVGQTSSGPGVHHGFITCRASGTLTNFDASGYFLNVGGLTAGSTAMLSTTSQTLKCLLDSSTTRYMVLSQMADGLGLGNSTTAMDFSTTYSTHAIEVYTTSASTNTSNSVRPIYMLHKATGTGGVGHRAEFHTRCDVVLGTWCNALKGYWEWDNDAGTGTSGRTTGLSSAVCAELKMPDAAVPTGHYYPLEVEFVGQTNSGPGVHHGFITMRASGTLTNFDDHGFLFDIQGLTDADNHMMNSSFSEDTSPAINATLRIQVGTTTWYIPLSDTKDCS